MTTWAIGDLQGCYDPLQRLLERIRFVRTSLTDGEQRQIVVAEHHHALFAQRMHEAQCFERLPAAIHQVAAEPQAIAGRVEPDAFEQSLQRVVAALEVADGPGRHARGVSAACAAW